MVHCISSSEPDSGDIQATGDDWRIQGITTKEITLSQAGLHGKTYVESTVTTGIQVGNRVEQGHHLTIIDQPADTTHPENTYDLQEHMDTSSPNHSINSDTMEHSSAEEQLINIDKNNISLRDNLNSLPHHLNNGHYQPILCHNNYVVPNQHVYRQQTLLPDHADYTLMPESKFNTRLGNSQAALNSQIYRSRNNIKPENHNLVNRSFANRHMGGINYNVATPELYPHLYDCRPNSNGLAVANYHHTNKPFVNTFITNQFAYDDQSEDESDDDDNDDSSDDEEE